MTHAQSCPPLSPERRQIWSFLLHTYGRPPRECTSAIAPRREPSRSAPDTVRHVRAQIIFWIDDEGVVHAEAPGRNGMREKLNIEIPRMLVADLQIRADEARERERAEAAERHRRIWDTCALRPGQGQQFAEKTIGPRRSTGFFTAPKPPTTSNANEAKPPRAKTEPVDVRLGKTLDLESI